MPPKKFYMHLFFSSSVSYKLVHWAWPVVNYRTPDNYSLDLPVTGGLLTGIWPIGFRCLTSCLSSHPVSSHRLQGNTLRVLDRADLTTTLSHSQPRPRPCSAWLTTTSFSQPSSRPRILNSSTYRVQKQGVRKSGQTASTNKAINSILLTCPILNGTWLVDLASNLDPVLPHSPIRLQDTSASVSAKSWLPVDTYKMYSSSVIKNKWFCMNPSPKWIKQCYHSLSKALSYSLMWNWTLWDTSINESVDIIQL